MSAEPVADFHRLERRLRLTGTLTTRTGLRIGSGGGNLDTVDLPVLRDAGGSPFIPGGSLKGSLRSTIESLVRGAGCARSTGLWACDPLLEQEGQEGACGYHMPGGRAKVDVDQHCAVCRLFGSRIVASHSRFTDAIRSAEDRASGHASVELRDGVAIGRDLRVAADKGKYDFEVVSPGTRFELEVFVENPRPWLLGLLVIGFDQIADGFTALGGFTSRGLGRVELEWSSLTEITARALLEGQDPETLTGTDLVSRFAASRRALAERARKEG
jgi:CRISPR-associated protein Csm3